MFRFKNQTIFAYHLTFATLNLYFAYNDLSCVQLAASPFSLQTWLLVDGYMQLAIAVETFLLWLAKMLAGCFHEESRRHCFAEFMTCFSIFTTVCYLLGIMFRFAWMVIGALVFWGELNKLNVCTGGKNGVGTYMWVYLIILGVYYGLMVFRGLLGFMVAAVKAEQPAEQKKEQEQQLQHLIDPAPPTESPRDNPPNETL